MNYIKFQESIRKGTYNLSGLESHSYYEIYFLYDGTRDFFYNQTHCEITAPMVIIIPPFTPHLTQGRDFKRINLYVSPNILEKINIHALTKHRSPCFLRLDSNKSEELYNFLKTPCGFSPNDEDVLVYQKAYCYTMIRFLIDNATLLDENELINSSNPIYKVVEYINANYLEKITLQSLCEKFFYTRNTLIRHFQSTLHCSINDYILFVRLNRAKDLLYKTKMSISDIAEQCGFSSQNHFSLTFTKKMGTSPSAYRKTR